MFSFSGIDIFLVLIGLANLALTLWLYFRPTKGQYSDSDDDDDVQALMPISEINRRSVSFSDENDDVPALMPISEINRRSVSFSDDVPALMPISEIGILFNDVSPKVKNAKTIIYRLITINVDHKPLPPRITFLYLKEYDICVKVLTFSYSGMALFEDYINTNNDHVVSMNNFGNLTYFIDLDLIGLDYNDISPFVFKFLHDFFEYNETDNMLLCFQYYAGRKCISSYDRNRYKQQLILLMEKWKYYAHRDERPV